MKELAVGIVGAAVRGSSFNSAFANNPLTRIVALCDIDMERLRRTATNMDGVELYDDQERMLDGAKPDIVVVGTPMPFHASQCKAALERDMHVLSEVPAAVSMQEAQELVQVAKKSKGKYMMAENYCYFKQNVLIKQIANAGLFGRMYFAEGEYVHELKGLNEVTKWRRRWQTGVNGCTYPTHSLGPVLQWTGERVVSLSCAGTGHHYQDPRGDYYENEDSILMLCRLGKGGLAKIRVDMISDLPHNCNAYSLQGTDGCYESSRGMGDQDKIWLRSKSDRMEWMPLSDLEHEFLPDEWLNPPKEALEAGHSGGDYWQIRDFIDAIVKDKKPPIGIHEAMDMTLPGLVSQESIQRDSAWLPVPDSRDW